MLCDGRLVCGCADPYGQRVLGRRATVVDPRGLGRRHHHPAARRPERWRLEILRRLSAEAAAQEGRDARRCGRSTPDRCRAGCSSSARRPATSRAPRRAARRKPASPARARRACSTSICSAGSSTKSGPSLGRIDFFNYGEAFLHKRAIEMCEYIKTRFPHIYLYTSTNGLAFSEAAGATSRALRHRRSDLLDRRRHAGELREVPAARASSTSPSRNLRAMADEKRRSGRRRAVSQLALHPLQLERQRRRDGPGAAHRQRHRRRPSVLGADRPSGRRVLTALCARQPALDAIRPRDVGPQQPGQRDPRRDAAARIDVRTLVPGPADFRPRRTSVPGQDARAAISPRARFPPRRATAAGSSGSARSCAQPTARSSTATSPAASCAKRWRAATPSTSRSQLPALPAAGQVRAEVRSGLRRRGLVRALRLADTMRHVGQVARCLLHSGERF